MARHAQPREAAELKGSTRKDPQRYAGEVVKSDLPIGPPPDHLTEGQQKCWFELESYALPGVLTGSDRIMLELASELLAKRRGWVEVPEGVSVTVAVQLKNLNVGERNTLVGILARLGMSPSDRQRFTTDDESTANPFANLEQ